MERDRDTDLDRDRDRDQDQDRDQDHNQDQDQDRDRNRDQDRNRDRDRDTDLDRDQDQDRNQDQDRDQNRDQDRDRDRNRDQNRNRDRDTDLDRDQDRDRDRDRDPTRRRELCPSPERPRARPGPTRWGICSAGAISHDFVLALGTLPRSEHTVTPPETPQKPPQIHPGPPGTAKPTGTPKTHRDPRGHQPRLRAGPGDPAPLRAHGFLDAFFPGLAPPALPGPFPVPPSPSQSIPGFWTRFFPAWRRLRSLAHSQSIPVPPSPSQYPQSLISGFLGCFWVGSGSFGSGVALTPPPLPQLPSHMNCPTELLWGGRRERFPLPPPARPPNFPHGAGLRYEAQHVRECLLRGLTESPEMPLAESELIARLLDQARAQVGVGPAGATPDPE
ncbi:RNA-binding protein 26-like [Passer montanus]|uniref:RNA-binding protein 26-like n=1 Tax=Passer montanus TaxID=9160 RepID=UPI00195FC83C|nr:RNA-binding protein 26-like [Passer montanus]